MSTAHTRFNQIDLLRGIACLSVIFFHFLTRGQQAGWLTDQPPQYIQHIAALGHLGVHLFFMISGFVILMTAQNASTTQFIASRTSRLYPAFWIGVLLTALFATLSPFVDSLPALSADRGTPPDLTAHPNPFSVSTPQVLINLTMFPHWLQTEFVDGSYWSLAVEIQFYLLIITLLSFNQIRKIERWIAAWLLISTLNALRPIYPLQFWLNAQWAPLFCAGMLSFRIHQKGWNEWRYLLLLWSFPLTLFYGITDALHAHTKPNPVLLGSPTYTALILCSFYAIFIAIANKRLNLKASPLITWAGALTYPVYVIHQNIGYITLSLPFGAWQAIPFSIRLTLTLLLIGILSWLTHILVEKPLAPYLRAVINAFPSSPRSTKTPQPNRS